MCVLLLSYIRLFATPGSSVHGVFQARILEWVAISPSRGSSWPRDRTCVSICFCIGRWILYHWATWDSVRFTEKNHETVHVNRWVLCYLSYIPPKAAVPHTHTPTHNMRPHLLETIAFTESWCWIRFLNSGSFEKHFKLLSFRLSSANIS